MWGRRFWKENNLGERVKKERAGDESKQTHRNRVESEERKMAIEK